MPTLFCRERCVATPHSECFSCRAARRSNSWCSARCELLKKSQCAVLERSLSAQLRLLLQTETVLARASLAEAQPGDSLRSLGEQSRSIPSTETSQTARWPFFRTEKMLLCVLRPRRQCVLPFRLQPVRSRICFEAPKERSRQD